MLLPSTSERGIVISKSVLAAIRNSIVDRISAINRLELRKCGFARF
jgi:hypothetical protein